LEHTNAPLHFSRPAVLLRDGEKEGEEGEEGGASKGLDGGQGNRGRLCRSRLHPLHVCLIRSLCSQILMDIIGRGAFGVVWRAVHRTVGNWVAIKRVKLNATKKKKLQLSSLMVCYSISCVMPSHNYPL